jgi:hypothetical protein
MRRLILTCLYLSAICCVSFGQIYKGQWLTGANVSLTTFNSYLYPHNTPSATIVPDIGYFFEDKLAGGLRFDVNWSSPNGSSSFATYGFSPFLRYYLLPAENRSNFFAATSFGWQIASPGGGFWQWTLSAGPSIFISPSLYAEFALQYANYSSDLYTDYHPRSFAVNLGFHFYFGR